MDPDQYKTPQKPFSRRSPVIKFFAGNSSLGTPQNKLKYSETTPSSISKRRTGAFNIFPIINTPPSRFPKIVNPFEAALTERLHLPLICSPSLFQRPTTPQHSSTQFEWTIEEVSSLGPANVEPHETQFQATPDPDLEAKAQAAISSYFKDQQIVPSPVDCPLRNQKIILSEPTGNTPVARSGRRIRDGITQTILTFPPILPDEMEGFLRKFCSFNDNQQQSPTNNCDITIDYDARDASLRRKLFETSNHSEVAGDVEINNLIKYDEFSPPPKSPELENEPLTTHNSGSPFNKSSFGSLSPISKLNSPNQLNKVTEIKKHHTKPCVDLSPLSSTNYPIKAKKTISPKSLPRTSSNSSLYESTPDAKLARRGSSPANMSVDVSFHGRINQFVAKKSAYSAIKSKSFSEADMFNSSYNAFDDDDMQVSQLSVQSTSSSNSSQHPDTPVRKRRSASRKNLSQSFSCHLSDDDNEDNIDRIGEIKAPPLQIKKAAVSGTCSVNINGESERSVFYRTDSGFNETSNTQDECKLPELKVNELNKENCVPIIVDVSMNEDVSMICCSTPSRTPRF